jgi:ketose-bisphosphate aldolase
VAEKLNKKRALMTSKLKNIISLKQLLAPAQKAGFAVGAFSPRYTAMIRPVLRAAEHLQSPAIVQIAQVELRWYQLTLGDFARTFWQQIEELQPTAPIGLHLDHTQDIDLIKEAIALGFTSVMIDASHQPLEGNMATTRQVVAYAHEHRVSVEAELGKIGTADFIESDTDEEMYTDPQEAALFVTQTGVDALAVSVGTAHGVYLVRQPKVDIERLSAIRALTEVALVLHGGSGVPAEMVHQAIHLPGGGVSKVNIATDLELGLLAALGRKERTTEAGLNQLSAAELELGADAVQAVVEEKMVNFLGSEHKKGYYPLA